MKFLADENLESLIVEWLRQAGHDVWYAAESAASSRDEELLDIAFRERRVVITNDLDFGDLVYHRGKRSAGIVLLRLEGATDHQRLAELQPHWPEIEPRCADHFIVVRPEKLRIRPLTLE